MFFILLAFLKLSSTAEAVGLIYLDQGYGACSTPCNPATRPGYDYCYNGPSNTNSNGCGIPCEVGNPWEKFHIECKNVAPPGPRENCQWVWQKVGPVCSTADKCESGPFLKAGACDCSTGGTYKICCTDQGVSSQACVKQSVDTVNPPYEGVCPAGTKTTLCGVSESTCAASTPYPCTTATCGAAACKPTCDQEPGTPAGDECTSCTERTYYKYNCDGSKTSTIKPDSSCENEYPSCRADAAPSPQPSPTQIVCNQAYGGVCGCKPGTGCLDGESTDYRCCYRTCDQAARACVTRAVEGAFPKGTLNNNGALNKCDNNSQCGGQYNGICQVSGSQAYFKVSGPPCSNCSYAKYSDGSFAWQGESIPSSGSFTHQVDNGKTFTFYVNGKPWGTGFCNVKSGQCVTDDDCAPDYQCEDP